MRVITVDFTTFIVCRGRNGPESDIREDENEDEDDDDDKDDDENPIVCLRLLKLFFPSIFKVSCSVAI